VRPLSQVKSIFDLELISLSCVCGNEIFGLFGGMCVKDERKGRRKNGIS
jgi:hypothetical protein